MGKRVGDYMEGKDFNDIDVKGTIIKTLIMEGNKYIPYVSFVKSIFGSGYLNEIKKLNPIIEDYIITYKNIKYVTLMAVNEILKRCNDENLKINIGSQIIGISLKEKNYIAKLEMGIEAIVNLKNRCDQLYNKIHDYDLKQCDLLHELENAKNTKDVADRLKNLRVERRKVKDDYRVLNYVKTNLDSAKIDTRLLGTTLVKYKEILKEINQEEVIYFNRDGSNKEIMEEKIKMLSDKFNKK